MYLYMDNMSMYFKNLFFNIQVCDFDPQNLTGPLKSQNSTLSSQILGVQIANLNVKKLIFKIHRLVTHIYLHGILFEMDSKIDFSFFHYALLLRSPHHPANPDFSLLDPRVQNFFQHLLALSHETDVGAVLGPGGPSPAAPSSQRRNHSETKHILVKYF